VSSTKTNWVDIPKRRGSGLRIAAHNQRMASGARRAFISGDESVDLSLPPTAIRRVATLSNVRTKERRNNNFTFR
jgi:hypothetical protein